MICLFTIRKTKTSRSVSIIYLSNDVLMGQGDECSMVPFSIHPTVLQFSLTVLGLRWHFSPINTLVDWRPLLRSSKLFFLLSFLGVHVCWCMSQRFAVIFCRTFSNSKNILTLCKQPMQKPSILIAYEYKVYLYMCYVLLSWSQCVPK